MMMKKYEDNFTMLNVEDITKKVNKIWLIPLE
jgi:hypothetical protein